jgi:hypothetical protein
MANPDERLKQINQILDYIRTNLINIQNTWGAGSPQYRSAVEIMERALVENATRLMFKESELEDLMGKLHLEEAGKGVG